MPCPLRRFYAWGLLFIFSWAERSFDFTCHLSDLSWLFSTNFCQTLRILSLGRVEADPSEPHSLKKFLIDKYL